MILLLALLGCDPYSDVAQVDTVQAYESYLQEYPTGANSLRATVRLEELMLEAARASGNLADWDAYLKRFPEGIHHETAVREREGSLYNAANVDMTVAAWEAYLSEYPKGPADHNRFAKKALDAARYAVDLTVGEASVYEINLGRDPTGPMNGWQIDVPITNGPSVVDSMWFRVHYLAADGSSLVHKDWPLVSPLREFPVPVANERTLPLQPGETRTWMWTSELNPEGWTKKVRLVPLRVRLGGGEPSATP